MNGSAWASLVRLEVDGTQRVPLAAYPVYERQKLMDGLRCNLYFRSLGLSFVTQSYFTEEPGQPHPPRPGALHPNSSERTTAPFTRLGQRGGKHHRDGGRDPTELTSTAQPVLHRPTGACHTNRTILPQPVMGGVGWWSSASSPLLDVPSSHMSGGQRLPLARLWVTHSISQLSRVD